MLKDERKKKEIQITIKTQNTKTNTFVFHTFLPTSGGQYN